MDSHVVEGWALKTTARVQAMNIQTNGNHFILFYLFFFWIILAY